jgi:thioredoxin 1
MRRSTARASLAASFALLSLLLPRPAAAFAAARFATTRLAAPLRRAGGALLREIPLLEDEAAYDALIASATADNRVVCIKFYASWCRACKAMAPKFTKVAEDFPQIEFHEVLFDNNKKLCKKLGIKVLPYMEIVAGFKGKTDGFTCGPSKISMLMAKLEDTSEAHCDVESIECTDISALLDQDD